MQTIFLMGLTSTSLGAMENHNLGNYEIIEPLIIALRRTFPDYQIVTSIQLSDHFCKKFGVISRRNQRFWAYGKKTAIETGKDIVRIMAWLFLKSIFRVRSGVLLRDSALLRELAQASLVIDFSGDLYGENSNGRRLLEASAELLFAKALRKPTAMIVGSPGPFIKPWKRLLARLVLNRVDLIANREPLSTELIAALGVRNTNVFTTACPSFLFVGNTCREVASIMEEEGIPSSSAESLIGIIISGWNMPRAPYNRVPRDENELYPFIVLIRHLRKQTGANIVLISHHNRTDEHGNLIQGSDHLIINQIMGILESQGGTEGISAIQGCYDAATMKGLISCCDMLVSGRLHGAIAGISQGIPTVILDYGHEPKAHKLRGIAKLVGIERFFCNPMDPKDMIGRAMDCWQSREEVAIELKERVGHIKTEVEYNMQLLRELVSEHDKT